MITYHYVLMAHQHQTFLFLHWSFQIYKMYYQTDLPKKYRRRFVLLSKLSNVYDWMYTYSFIQYFLKISLSKFMFFLTNKGREYESLELSDFIIIEYWYSKIHHIFNEWSNSCLKWRSTEIEKLWDAVLKFFSTKLLGH